MLLYLLACDAPPGETEDPEVTADTCGDWYTVGAPFALTYCASCHAAGLTGSARHGAPEGLDLADLASLRTNVDAARRAVSAGTMPPTGGPSATEIASFLAWIDCGAPGDDTPMPTPAASDVTLRGAWEVMHEVELADDFPEGLTVTARQLGQGSTTGFAVLSTERYTLTDTDAWLVERARVDEDGATVFVDSWEPPLQVMSDRAEWVVETTRTRDTDTESFGRDETWHFTLGADPDLDPRLGSPGEVYVLGVEEATGAEIAFYLSGDRGMDGRRFVDTGDFADPFGAAFEVRILNAMPRPGALPAFPLTDGQAWNAFLLQWDPA